MHLDGKGPAVADDLAVKKACENITALREEISELDRKMKEVSENAKKEREASNGEDEVNGI